MFCFRFIENGAVGLLNDVSSHSPIADVLANNVERFGTKDGKNRSFRGPNDGGMPSSPRESIRQVLHLAIWKDSTNLKYWTTLQFLNNFVGCQFNLQKPRDKKPVRVSRQKRHLMTQHREIGFRGPTNGELTLMRMQVSSTKPTSTQATGNFNWFLERHRFTGVHSSLQ